MTSDCSRQGHLHFNLHSPSSASAATSDLDEKLYDSALLASKAIIWYVIVTVIKSVRPSLSLWT